MDKLRNFKPPKFCQNGTPRKATYGIDNYWVALKDFTYNEKADRDACRSPFAPRTKEYVEDTKVKKGQKLKQNFRYDFAVEKMKKDGFIAKASEEQSEVLLPEGEAPKGFGDPIKDKKWILYVVLAVAGYFAYKKFKK